MSSDATTHPTLTVEDAAVMLGVPVAFLRTLADLSGPMFAGRDESDDPAVSLAAVVALRGAKDAAAKVSYEKFWVLVDVSDGCWEWKGIRNRGGYGVVVRYDENGKRKHLMAHRFAHMITKGPIPQGLLVLHRCDNPACVRPSHLFLGTHQDNTADMMAKGRINARSGEEHGRAKLTRKQIVAIRAGHEAGESFASLGRRFGVSATHASRIVKGEVWGNATQKTTPQGKRTHERFQ